MKGLKKTLKRNLRRTYRKQGLTEQQIWDGMDMYKLRRHIVIDPRAIHSSMRKAS